MINFNEQLTQDQAKWVLDHFHVFAHRIAHSTLATIAEMHNKVFKEQVGIPGCGCEYQATHRVWTSRLHQYQPQIEAVAYPVIKTPINEDNIIVEAVTEIQTLPNEIRVKTTRGKKKK